MHLERFGKLSNIVYHERFVNLDHAAYLVMSKQEGGTDLRLNLKS